MATITAGDFRNGIIFEDPKNQNPCVVVEFQHVKPGKGAAFVRTKSQPDHRHCAGNQLQPHCYV